MLQSRRPILKGAMSSTAMHKNRLAQETSPYLLQHQHNPVDWYAWGPEAFEASRAQDKPIFLSVGYSTCYWCHVMERQSFENEAVAVEMNKRFINIKVDREERPDVDQLYMTAVQVLTRHGGWPMSVFLTPDLRPFYGGTYFPPDDAHGRPGFVSVVRGIEDAYRNRKNDVEQTANQLVNILRDLSQPQMPAKAMRIDEKYVADLIERSASDYEPTYGGFGMAPKFPRETLLELLLQSQIGNRKSQIEGMLRHTLDAMANGGIRDQLGGGFHRYSTDAKWLVPHFEIMLYDNAMLGWCYAEASRQFAEPRYAQIAREVFDFVLREMTSPEGAFYTAFDAEVDAQEGLSYLWVKDEIEQVLGAEDAKLFNRVYGVDQGPNFADPHHGTGQPDKNILYLADGALALSQAARLAEMTGKLKAHRDQRKQPLLDTKIITSWNALMIRALAHGGEVLQEPRYRDAASRAAMFLLDRHRMPEGGLYRTSRDGVAKYAGFLDDYAFLVQALLALKWRDKASALATTMLEKFGEADRGGLFFTEKSATDLIVRQKTASDSPLPSGNAIAALAFIELDQPAEVRRILKAFAAQMERGAEGMSSMVDAAMLYVQRHGPIEVKPDAQAASREEYSPEIVAHGVVSMRASWESPTEVHILLDILDTFHINAHEASEGLIGTSLAVVDAPDTKVEYPPGEERGFAFADRPIRVYEDSAVLVVRFSQPVDPTRELMLRLTYQACDESACLPPVTKQFHLPSSRT
jgi:uncharacterized protein